MGASSIVTARVDDATKAEATAVLSQMGLSLSDAFRLLLRRVAADQALPFEPFMPNAETIAAMNAARAGDLITVGSTAELIVHLDAGTAIATSGPAWC